jgi:hypothetical protein
MALVVGTNSYVSRTDTDTYFSDILNSVWGSKSTAERDAALVTATGMIDNEYQFIGVSVSASQPLAWPRTGAAYAEPKTGRLTTTNDDEVPARVILAVQAQAEHLLRNPDLLSDGDQTFERIKVGPIEIEDKMSNYSKPPKFPNSVRTLLDPLLVKGSASNTWWRAN